MSAPRFYFMLCKFNSLSIVIFDDVLAHDFTSCFGAAGISRQCVTECGSGYSVPSSQRLPFHIADHISPSSYMTIAKACGVSERAVYKWLKNGFLPKTEFFGKTKYASKIEEISGGKYQASEMLEISKKNLLAA